MVEHLYGDAARGVMVEHRYDDAARGVTVEHRYGDAARPGSSSQRGRENQPNIIHLCDIIPNLFPVYAAQSRLLFPAIAAVISNIENEGLTMVQAPCGPRDRG